MSERATDDTLEVLKRQASNIARIHPGLEVSGTGIGESTATINSKRPDVIMLYDTPDRLVESAGFQHWERVITLQPVTGQSSDAIAGRTDRTFGYWVSFLVRLRDSEVQTHKRQTLQGGLQVKNPLADKVHTLLRDWHLVFYDNLHLKTDGDPQGLVDHATYATQWRDTEYPRAGFRVEVAAQIPGYC